MNQSRPVQSCATTGQSLHYKSIALATVLLSMDLLHVELNAAYAAPSHLFAAGNPIINAIQNNTQNKTMYSNFSPLGFAAITDETAQHDLDLILGHLISHHGLNPMVSMIALHATSKLRPFYHEDYAFQIQQTPLCQGRMRKITFGEHRTLLLGQTPVIDEPSFDANGWDQMPNLQLIGARYGEPVEQSYPEKCLWLNQGKLTPAWRLPFENFGRPVEVTFSDSGVHMESPFALDLKPARLQVFWPNRQQSPTWIQTNVSESSQFDAANFKVFDEKTGRLDTLEEPVTIDLDKDESLVKQAHIYSYVSRQLDFFKQLNFDVGPLEKISIAVNSAYAPGYRLKRGNSKASIVIGDMVREHLVNMHFDSDVVSHEFSHHVIAQSINDFSITQESVALQEGLADFFAMAGRQDSCFAPTTCAPNTNYISCQLFKNQCLRSAANQIRYHDSQYESPTFVADSHYRGLLVSGLMWDLGTITKDRIKVAQLALNALQFVPPSASIRDFVKGLYFANLQFNFNWKDEIDRATAGRNMSVAELGIDQSELENVHEELKIPDPIDSMAQSKFNRATNKAGCATLTSPSTDRQSPGVVLAIILAPILFQICTRSIVRRKYKFRK
jgi:hypothetical protein